MKLENFIYSILQSSKKSKLVYLITLILFILIIKFVYKIKFDETVHNFVRGMSPYPTAFTILKVGDEEKSLKIFKGKFELELHSREGGDFDISKTEFKFYTKDGIYYPEDVQIQGKKRLPVKDFLNGI